MPACPRLPPTHAPPPPHRPHPTSKSPPPPPPEPPAQKLRTNIGFHDRTVRPVSAFDANPAPKPGFMAKSKQVCRWGRRRTQIRERSGRRCRRRGAAPPATSRVQAPLRHLATTRRVAKTIGGAATVYSGEDHFWHLNARFTSRMLGCSCLQNRGNSLLTITSICICTSPHGASPYPSSIVVLYLMLMRTVLFFNCQALSQN